MKKRYDKIFIIIALIFCFISSWYAPNVKAQEIASNPFILDDAKIQEMAGASKEAYKPSLFSSKQTDPAPDNRTGYIVQFKQTASLNQIAELINGLDYKLLAESELRIFLIHTDIGYDALAQKLGDAVESMSEDKKLQLFDTASVTQTETSDLSTMSVPNDPYYSNQWYLPTMNMPKAWDIKNDASNVYVAVIDSGIERGISLNDDLTNADIRAGYDFITDSSNVTWDRTGHGTKVTGIIAATSNNNIGISGIAQNVVIIPISIVWSDGYIDESDLINAIYLAAEAGCDVINLSLGGNVYDPYLDAITQYAYNCGCIVIASAGNSGINEYNFPASNFGVISVGSIDNTIYPSSFSTYNDMVDIAAPGRHIYTTDEGYGNNYVYVDGTSFSAPCISGIAALARSCDPYITPASFEQILKASATDIYTTGYDTHTGAGLVNAQALLIWMRGVPGYFINNGVLIEYVGAGGKITVPDNVTSIGDSAFLNKTSITNIILPDGLTNIGKSSFSSCSNLAYIDLPKGVTTIGDNAFNSCRSLTRISIPNSVTSISSSAFANCGNLIIYCQPDSYTETFAVQNGIPHSHDILLSYQGHVQNIGWQYPVINGELCGTSGMAYRVEALKINLINAPAGLRIKYRGHVQNIGWQDWVYDGAIAGTSGMAYRVEAIQIKLEGTDADKYSVEYQGHVENIGWQNWVWDGVIAGTSGQALRVEAIKIKIVDKLPAIPNVVYEGHVQNIGWQDWVRDGDLCGTSGLAYRVEAFKIKLENAPEGLHIRYMGHVQNIGWQDWAYDGALCGTSGQALRVEALQIMLEGTDADKYSVEYQAHVQNIGWQPWVKDGQIAGTSGMAYRIEAVRIRIVPKIYQ